MRPDELERRLRERLDALGPAPRAELLHVLMLPDFERADRIGEFWSYPESRTFAELLIDCEEDRTLRAVLVGMLREADVTEGPLETSSFPGLAFDGPHRHRWLWSSSVKHRQGWRLTRRPHRHDRIPRFPERDDPPRPVLSTNKRGLDKAGWGGCRFLPG